MNNDVNIVQIVKLIIKNIKLFVIVGIVSITLAVVVSLNIEELFQSKALFFPAESSSVNTSTDELDKNLTELGGDTQIEQTLQIMASMDIKKKVIDKFNLFEHYRIDKSSPFAFNKVIKLYKQRIQSSKTSLNAIEVSVLDHSPDTAALIANYVSNLVDTVRNDMAYTRLKQTYDLVKMGFEREKENLNSLNDSIKVLSLMGVVSDEGMAAIFDGLSLASSKKNEKSIRYFKKLIDINQEYGYKYEYLKQSRLKRISILEEKRELHNQLFSSISSRITHKFTLEKAYPAERKIYPVRWLLVAITLISSELLTLFIILIILQLKKLKKTEI